MTSISIQVEDLQQPLRLTLHPGDSVLIGRAPDMARLPDELRRPEPRTLTVPSALVSANHLLLRAGPAGVQVQDLCAVKRQNAGFVLPSFGYKNRPFPQIEMMCFEFGKFKRLQALINQKTQ